ncbi:hypothetical protein DVT68_10505 [Dyella solisilvae]|uniref:Uncharacterized protein n=1 Tax=Dyella solisilvae TaxID=1920168 RepID=A0A370K8F6_9GAMM|nr:hypothetical protein DVT68_10505 [Dyella solisilvae]
MSQIVQQAEQHLTAELISIGNPDILYLRCFRTGARRELALSRTAQQLYLWSEPVWERANPTHQGMRKRRYAAEDPRIHTLEANAPRLYAGHAADYWQFPTLGDLQTFVAWYKAL